jgi:hypothetical protein
MAESPAAPVVYFHWELPPLEAEVIGVHRVEATSARCKQSFGRGDKLWTERYEDLIANARHRLGEEVTRLGGDCARVYEEVIDTRRDDATGEAWLHGRFDFVLYRRPRAA